MFPEGGNYSHREAVRTVQTLNEFSNVMFEKQTEINKVLKQNYCEKIDEIKEWLSITIKPFVLIISLFYTFLIFCVHTLAIV